MRAIVALALCMATAVQAQENPEYQAFEGARLFTTHGYQDLMLSEDRWYVALQGSKDTAPDWVEQAWATRSAQLCAAVGKQAFVELRYSFEDVAKDGEKASNEGAIPHGLLYRVATPVYIPIYTPSGPRSMPPTIGPSKLAAIQCIADGQSLKNPARAVSVAATLEKARQSGFKLSAER